MLVLPQLVLAAVIAAEFKAGVARVKITPESPVYLSGYASRNHPSDGVEHDIWAKALAIEDKKAHRVVIVTTDLIGLPRAISDEIAARVAKQHGLDRSQLMLNSSHTHTGPAVRANLSIMFDLKPEDSEAIAAYTRKLTDDLVALIGTAIGGLAPSDLRYGSGETKFAMNRREPRDGTIRLGVNPTGPVDHSVPVLTVTANGAVKAVLFGYACHNTTLTGEFYKISGDYAGYAQSAVEAAIPGATAMFTMLAGGDQNPNPRSKLELAQQHGAALGAEVARVARGKMETVKGPLRTAFLTTDLAFAPHTRQTFEALTADRNVYKARNAKYNLGLYDAGRPLRQYAYPVQAIAFGKSVTIVALGGELVIDYALRLKREHGARGLIVAGYSNDVMSYIPSKRVLDEGGYESVDSQTYYGMPGPWAGDVEERVIAAAGKALDRVKHNPRR